MVNMLMKEETIYVVVGNLPLALPRIAKPPQITGLLFHFPSRQRLTGLRLAISRNEPLCRWDIC